jgi:hypothetical protein
VSAGAAMKCAALLLVLALSACTTFEHPIIGENGPTLDPRLVGRWTLENDEGRYEVEIRPDGDAGLVHPLRLESNAAEDPDEPVDMRLITARLGSLDFGSALPIGRTKEGWTLFRYQLAGDQLTIIFSDDEFWRSAVTDKRITGTINKGPQLVTAHVSAKDKELRDFLLGYAPVGFPDDPEPEFIFQRER